MILWTIQPEKVFMLIQKDGVYHCDIHKSGMEDFADLQYSWLVSQMKKRIGPPPAGVSFPVWAWYQWRKDRKKPDLRWERWNCSPRGAKFYRLEIEIPDSEVLLSDFDAWGIILNEGLLADTEEEDERLDKVYDSLPPEEQKAMRAENWEKVFDLTPVNTEWMIRGEDIQATFWELRKEQIREARMFISTFNPKRWS